MNIRIFEIFKNNKLRERKRERVWISFLFFLTMSLQNLKNIIKTEQNKETHLTCILTGQEISSKIKKNSLYVNRNTESQESATNKKQHMVQIREQIRRTSEFNVLYRDMVTNKKRKL